MSETRSPRGSGRLVLDLRAGDRMLVNGAALQFKTRTSVMLSNRARFLFGKQIMSPEDARTPARRVYFAIQAAYIAEEEERDQYVGHARLLADEYAAATTSPTARNVLAQAIADLETGDCWEAMRRVRVLFAHDDAMLGEAALAAPVAAPRPG
ncbi:flagellar biosynthesis repressor FlbT [Pseudoroseomonas cervicalis]|uniref:Putative flagellar biosynthesis repressor FlbT n=1 Tax=Pseudoroseomonas cervicalis ATCC 49957 TaxID=525371 RepID=D5RP65_9PROT|nr:flagellar biosynthesis repressor FlbT [Pseudoroseomonas cervicalis]EFH10903.1 putative flagellar biosynthesis repressor FlbT [Pseudoroseomonas cervicalis ATCC 49957]WBV44597.1 flagellar biosynthesis repressor FlbT [Pseudoroseomonas cervicalis]